MMSIEISGKTININKGGYLTDFDQWEPAVAEAMACIDGAVLAEAHWEVIRFLRDYYLDYRVAPDLRVMSKSLVRALGTDKGSREKLAALFQDSPAETACRYAGLPAPVSSACV